MDGSLFSFCFADFIFLSLRRPTRSRLTVTLLPDPTLVRSRPRAPNHPASGQSGEDAMIIGSFQSCDDGYVGRVQTLSLDVELSIVRAERSETEGAPDWRIFLGNVADGVEIGVGRTEDRTSVV